MSRTAQPRNWATELNMLGQTECIAVAFQVMMHLLPCWIVGRPRRKAKVRNCSPISACVENSAFCNGQRCIFRVFPESSNVWSCFETIHFKTIFFEDFHGDKP